MNYSPRQMIIAMEFRNRLKGTRFRLTVKASSEYGCLFELWEGTKLIASHSNIEVLSGVLIGIRYARRRKRVGKVGGD